MEEQENEEENKYSRREGENKVKERNMRTWRWSRERER
jgi:hypothetical protein